jgi:hypothetical protein
VRVNSLHHLIIIVSFTTLYVRVNEGGIFKNAFLSGVELSEKKGGGIYPEILEGRIVNFSPKLPSVKSAARFISDMGGSSSKTKSLEDVWDNKVVFQLLYSSVEQSDYNQMYELYEHWSGGNLFRVVDLAARLGMELPLELSIFTHCAAIIADYYGSCRLLTSLSQFYSNDSDCCS